ncbi:uncharacterized protein LOC116106020 [Pistacia vera]|uniref:uncharacterized protein LOC116106020 n=1 Tax=Pistacia vera TaxID=55513 RepID=UPI0012632BDF|nr:uncharacterized protein LOC116106020 [Pistacia vera]
MQTYVGLGFMAVFAISGSIVLLANQVHKRLLSDFMKKIEFEISGFEKFNSKKKVRFAEDVMEPSSNNKEYRKKSLKNHHHHHGNRMPLNRQILYKGIIQYRTLRAQQYCI